MLVKDDSPGLDSVDIIVCYHVKDNWKCEREYQSRILRTEWWLKKIVKAQNSN